VRDGAVVDVGDEARRGVEGGIRRGVGLAEGTGRQLRQAGLGHGRGNPFG
jgi:hypothetical protein